MAFYLLLSRQQALQTLQLSVCTAGSPGCHLRSIIGFIADYCSLDLMMACDRCWPRLHSISPESPPPHTPTTSFLLTRST